VPEYEVTRADGTADTLAASTLADAVDRAGAHPEPISVRLKGGRRAAGQVLAEQPRHSSFAFGAETIGQCPVPGCDYISNAHGELQAHMLDDHGFAVGVSKRG
jgi:hypothetical protein